MATCDSCNLNERVTLRVAGVLCVTGMILVSVLAVISSAAYVFSDPGFALVSVAQNTAS